MPRSGSLLPSFCVSFGRLPRLSTRTSRRCLMATDVRIGSLCTGYGGLDMAAVSVFGGGLNRKSTRLNSSHVKISYAVFCLKKKKKKLDGDIIMECMIVHV